MQLPLVFVLFGAVLYFLYNIINICSTETLPASEAATRLFTYWQEYQSDVLPFKLRGVWWMSDNPAPELLVTFQGSKFDPAKRTMMFKALGFMNWTINTDCLGLILLLMMRPFFSIQWDWNEDYTFAKMPFYLFGCCKVPFADCFYRFSMTQKDFVGDLWERETFLFGCKWGLGSYMLRKIIDGHGEKLPDFDVMIQTIEYGVRVKGITRKTPFQRIPTHFLCFGPAPVAQSLGEQEVPAAPAAPPALPSLAACGSHAACPQLEGMDCCPNKQGGFLPCCGQVSTSGAAAAAGGEITTEEPLRRP